MRPRWTMGDAIVDSTIQRLLLGLLGSHLCLLVLARVFNSLEPWHEQTISWNFHRPQLNKNWPRQRPHCTQAFKLSILPSSISLLSEIEKRISLERSWRSLIASLTQHGDRKESSGKGGNKKKLLSNRNTKILWSLWRFKSAAKRWWKRIIRNIWKMPFSSSEQRWRLFRHWWKALSCTISCMKWWQKWTSQRLRSSSNDYFQTSGKTPEGQPILWIRQGYHCRNMYALKAGTPKFWAYVRACFFGIQACRNASFTVTSSRHSLWSI